MTLTNKTPTIDFGSLSLKDALDLAILVEDEAAERYQEFTDQMEGVKNGEAATFFRFMKHNEEKHGTQLSALRLKQCGTAPRTVRREQIFDVEAPEYDAVRTFMTAREALETALAAEEKAHAYFVGALEKVKDAEVRKLFEELREEEVEHMNLVKRELAKVAPDSKLGAEDYADEPVSQ